MKENGGQGSARNFGLQHATGEYIAYVDADDYVDLDMYEKMYQLSQKEKSDVVICGNKHVTMDSKIKKIEPAVVYNDKDLDIIFGQMAVWNKIYKKSLITSNNIEFRNKVWYEDIDFTIKLLLNNVKISFLNEPLYNYVLRPGSTMNNTNIARNLEILQAFDSMIEYFKAKKIYAKIYTKLTMLAIYHIYICGVTRVLRINGDNKRKKEVINIMINYVKNKFPDYQSNIYLKNLDKRKKIIYNLIECKNYWVIKLIFKIKK